MLLTAMRASTLGTRQNDRQACAAQRIQMLCVAALNCSRPPRVPMMLRCGPALCTRTQPVATKDQCRQMRSTQSLPPEAAIPPEGLQSTQKTSSACPGSSSFSLRAAASHTWQGRAVLSCPVCSALAARNAIQKNAAHAETAVEICQDSP